MNWLPQHPYLNTRVTLLAGRLLDREQLEQFARAASQAAAPPHTETTLSNSEQGLQRIIHQEITQPEQVLAVLSQGFMEDFMILLRPLSGPERDFMIYWLRKYEIANLRAIMRGKMAGLSAEQIRSYGLRDIAPFNSLPLNELLSTEDTAEMLRQLAHSPYAEAAEQARQVYEKQQSFYVVEATIAHRYLSGLQRRAKSIGNSAEREPLLLLLSLLLQRFNLIWALRYRFTYQLSPAETYYLLISGVGSSLIGQNLNTLVQATSVESMLAKIPADLQQQLENTRSITGIEQTIEEYVREQARKLLKRSQSALARTFSYLILRECEVQRLLAIAQGKQMQLSAEVIVDGVGLSENGAGFLL